MSWVLQTSSCTFALHFVPIKIKLKTRKLKLRNTGKYRKSTLSHQIRGKFTLIIFLQDQLNILRHIQFVNVEYITSKMQKNKPATLCTPGAGTSWRVLNCCKAARTGGGGTSMLFKFELLFNLQWRRWQTTHVTKEQEGEEEGQTSPHPRLEALWTPGEERERERERVTELRGNTTCLYLHTICLLSYYSAQERSSWDKTRGSEPGAFIWELHISCNCHLFQIKTDFLTIWHSLLLKEIMTNFLPWGWNELYK